MDFPRRVTPNIVRQRSDQPRLRIAAVLRRWFGLPRALRALSLVAALAVASWTFIVGLVILFDQVGATSGNGLLAWSVSLVGMLASAVVGVALGVLVLHAAARALDRAGGSPGRAILMTLWWAFVLLVGVLLVAAYVDP